jgi:hypothetical protein
VDALWKPEAKMLVCRWLLVMAFPLLVAACGPDDGQKHIDLDKTPQVGQLQKPLEKALGEDRSGLTRSNVELATFLANQMKNATARFKRPHEVHLGESFPVQLELSTDVSVVRDDADAHWKGFQGELRTAQLRVSQSVSAQLTGPPDMLRITPRDDKMKSLKFLDSAYWVWDVKPLRPGKATITLEVISYVQDGKDRDPYPIRVLQDTWEIEAYGLEWLKYEIVQIEPIRGFVYSITAGIVGVLAWFGISGRKRRRSDLET